MKRNCRILLLGVLTISSICGAQVRGGISPAANRRSTQVAVETWAWENHSAVLDLIFQDGCQTTRKSPQTRWTVCVRIDPGFQTELEYELSFEKHYDGTISARVMRPRTRSIYTQLYKLKTAHPRASANDLSKLIAVESEAGDQNKFPMLTHLAEEFENIRIAAPLSDELMMDATKYQFRMNAAAGEHMEMVLFGPGSSAPKQPQQILQWTEDLRKLLVEALESSRAITKEISHRSTQRNMAAIKEQNPETQRKLKRITAK